ncbi:PaaI family thioesterase [Novosphingobium cyanobacteriorum]|uniref:PaaI family thioesterase n=1 Tax=Novosphingobium cyanobacteriorum TaxID=3024215 RepID=A0ABT6CMY3_9SPHN|nr:PaaI family thioesterase [Novosphingobium cyanobacteriorum]MDF8335276.1 PaaI family thioesterase [Novosphingobium cyanobacteriorum]
MASRLDQDAAEATVRQVMESPPLRQLFGIDLVSVEPGRVVLGLDRRPEFGHQPGWFQGTVTSALAEYTASLSGRTMAPERDSMTLQQSIHFTGQARGDRLEAVGRVITAGRRISTTAADVYVLRDGERHLCATMTMTVIHVEHRVPENGQ